MPLLKKDPKVFYRWNTILYILIFYMQRERLLPVLHIDELQDVYDLFVKSDDISNISDTISKEYIERIKKQCDFKTMKPSVKTYGNYFQLIKMPKTIMQEIKSVKQHYQFINKRQNLKDMQYVEQKPGKLMLHFIKFLVTEFSTSSSIKKPVKIVNNLKVVEKATKQYENLFLVENPFNDSEVMSLLSSNIHP